MIKEIPLLEADDIEVRIKQVLKNNKALALLYKTSRTDMRILDEVFGIDGWKDDYKEIKGNLYCGISIWDSEKKEWVTKWDCGIESQQSDGNEIKAEASDAFKRAGTKIGIGRELYTAPKVFLAAETEEGQGKQYKLKNPYETYSVTKIDYNDRREIINLVIADSKGNTVFTYKNNNSPFSPYKISKLSNQQLILELIEGTDVQPHQITEYIETHFGVGLRANSLTDEQFNKLYADISAFINGEG